MRSTPMKNSGLEAVISHHEKKGAGRRAKAIAAIAYAAGSQIPFVPGEDGVFDGDVLEEAVSYIESLYPESKAEGPSVSTLKPSHYSFSVPGYGGERMVWEIDWDNGLIAQKSGHRESPIGPLPMAYFNLRPDTLPPILSPDPFEPESK